MDALALLGLAGALGVGAVGLAAGLHRGRDRLLATRLPQLEAQLSEALGAEVTLQEARLEADYRLRLLGARARWPGEVTLEVAEATLGEVPRAVLGRGAASPCLLELAGVLRLPGRAPLPGEWTLPLRYTAPGPPPPGQHLAGRIEVLEGFLQPEGGGPPTLAPVSLAGAVQLGGERLRLEGAHLELRGVALEGTATANVGQLDDLGAWELELRVAPTELGVLAELAAALGAPGPAAPGALAAAELEGDLRLRPRAGLAFEGDLRTARSRLRLELRRDPEGALDGSRGHGHVDLDDLSPWLPLGLVLELPGDVPLGGEFALRGPEATPQLRGELFAPRLGVGWADDPLRVELQDLQAAWRLDAAALTLAAASAGVYGGRLEARGERTRAPGAPRATLEIEARGLRCEQLPGPAGEALAAWVRGALGGELRLEGTPGDRSSLEARGELRLDDGRYPGLRRAEATLAGYGLPALDEVAKGPARARLSGRGGAWVLEQVEAAVEGVRLVGDVELRGDGTLKGDLEARLERSYLSRSPTLALPTAMVGDLAVPVRVGGDLVAPQADVDLVGVLEGVAGSSRVGAAMRGAMDTVWATLEGEGLRPGPELDEMIEAILAGGARAEDTLDRLVETGISADEVKWLLDDWRRRMGLPG